MHFAFELAEVFISYNGECFRIGTRHIYMVY